MPGTTVEVAFELTVGDTPYFRLNDPVKGKLNNTSYRLAGPIWIDITDRVANVSIKRGKNRELERYNAGNASISLHNEDRTFDPLNMSSPYVGNIIPRRAVRVTTSGVTQFTGVIEDWNLDYDVSGKSNAQIVAADAFTLLAQQSLTAGTATAQTTGERIEAVLSMPSVAWPLTQRNIDTGSSQVGADVWTTDDNALTYLQEVEASEQGQLFMDRNGYVRFVNGAVTPTTADAWSLVATNLVTNPSMEASSGTVTVRTNLSENPRMATTGLYPAPNYATVTITKNVAVPAPHPLGITTCAESKNTLADSGVLLSIYGADGRINTGSIQRTLGAWIYVNEAGYQIQGGSGWPSTTLAANTWTWIQQTTAVAAGGWAGLTIIKTTGLTSTTARAYITGVIAEAGTTVGDFFDGSFSPAGDFSYAWSATANASTSLQRAPQVVGLTGADCAAIQSFDWASTGAKSLRLVPTTQNPNSAGIVSISTVSGVTYTVKVKCRLSSVLTGTLSSNSRKLLVFNDTTTTLLGSSNVAPNAGGVTELTATFTAVGTTSLVLMYNGAMAGNGDVWFDDLMVVAGTYTGDYFDGSTTSTFTNRYTWTGTPNASTSLKEFTSYPLFSDSGDGIPYTSATISYGTELLYNQVKVTSPTATSIANNTASQTLYGITTTDVETLLSTSNAVASLALFWVAKYGEPEYRFQDLEISLDGLSATDVETALNIELGDIVQIKFTPNGVGDSIQRFGQVNKIEHSITPDRHNIVFGFGSLQFSFLVLDDTGFGILNENVLAF